MLTAAKNTSRPALAHARSSFNAGSSSRAASMLASGDIFDAPGRLIFEEEEGPTANSSLSASRTRKYYPSHFRPTSQEQNAQQGSSASSSAIPVALKTPSTSHAQVLAQQQQQQQQQPQARQLSTLAHHRAVNEGSTIMYDGPARPRNPPRVTSRHHVRAASTIASASTSTVNSEMKDHVFSPPIMPDPIIYDGPARPPRKVPVQMKKSSSSGADGSSSAVVGAVAGLVGLGVAYELHDANRNSQATPKNILSYTRSREADHT